MNSKTESYLVIYLYGVINFKKWDYTLLYITILVIFPFSSPFAFIIVFRTTNYALLSVKFYFQLIKLL